jgi:hypothetical protein
MNTTEWTAKDFDKSANSPSEWLFVADDLFAASRFLSEHSYHLSSSWPKLEDRFPSFDELRITPVILMLRSMAIECLLKGIYAKLCGPLAQNGRYKGIREAKNKINDHDLLQLAKAISSHHDLGLTDEGKDFIERLSRNLFRGRYPIHKAWTHHLLAHAGGDNRRIPGLMVPDHDDKLFHDVRARLRGFLHEEAAAMYGQEEKGGVMDPEPSSPHT